MYDLAGCYCVGGVCCCCQPANALVQNRSLAYNIVALVAGERLEPPTVLFSCFSDLRRMITQNVALQPHVLKSIALGNESDCRNSR
jgi:hypothetical protein